jgi:hypothetical protein
MNSEPNIEAIKRAHALLDKKAAPQKFLHVSVPLTVGEDGKVYRQAKGTTYRTPVADKQPKQKRQMRKFRKKFMRALKNT